VDRGDVRRSDRTLYLTNGKWKGFVNIAKLTLRRLTICSRVFWQDELGCDISSEESPKEWYYSTKMQIPTLESVLLLNFYSNNVVSALLPATQMQTAHYPSLSPQVDRYQAGDTTDILLRRSMWKWMNLATVIWSLIIHVPLKILPYFKHCCLETSRSPFKKSHISQQRSTTEFGAAEPKKWIFLVSWSRMVWLQ